MDSYDIRHVDETLWASIQQKIDNLNKPKGSLGRLEELAMQICLVQQTLTPRLEHPCHLLLGGDHGIEREGVSLSPREVTWQQMQNFTRGGGGCNMFCRQHGFDLRIVDVGVDHDFPADLVTSSLDSQTASGRIIDRKIAYGTRNFLHEAAMSEAAYEQALHVGAELVDGCVADGCNVLSIGEMGIGNTSPSSIWMYLFGNIPLADCIGAGSGLDAAGIRHKQEVLSMAVGRFTFLHPAPTIPEMIRYFGGFEMVTAIGAMLRAAELHLIILVDGFIMTACALAAVKMHPAAKDYMVFTHCGDERGHRRMLDLLDARPLLSLGLRLGEGTGSLCAYPLLDSAVRMVNEMNDFDSAHITKYF